MGKTCPTVALINDNRRIKINDHGSSFVSSQLGIFVKKYCSYVIWGRGR